jgi:hypothetical protein
MKSRQYILLVVYVTVLSQVDKLRSPERDYIISDELKRL